MKIQLTFYKIKEFGFYNALNSTHIFASVQDIIRDLTNWSEGKKLGATCTYAAGEDGQNAAYCFDAVEEKTGDFFVTIWNAAPKMNGAIATVSGDSKVGEAEVSVEKLKEDEIPGYPTYFWIIPSKNTYVMLTPENYPPYGNGSFSKFLSAFLSSHSKWRILKKVADDEDPQIIGYGDNGILLEKAEPRCEIGFHQRPGDIEALRAKYADVRKIVRKERVILGITGPEHILTNVFTWIGLKDKNISDEPTYRIKYEFSKRLSEIEFDHVVQHWTKSDQAPGTDLGFRMENDPKIHWLGRTIVREEVDWPVILKKGFIQPTDLLEQITKERQVLLTRIPTVHTVKPKTKSAKRKAPKKANPVVAS